MSAVTRRLRAAGAWVHQLMPGHRRTLRTARWWLLGLALCMTLLVLTAGPAVDDTRVLVGATVLPSLLWAWSVHRSYQQDAVLTMAIDTAVASVRALRPDLGDGTITVTSDRGVISRHVPRDPPA